MVSLVEGVRESSTYWYRAGRVVDLAVKLLGPRRARAIAYPLAGDVFYIFYLPFPRIARPGPLTGEEALRLAVLSEMLSSARTWKIKAHTVADAPTSIVAATIFSAALVQNLEKYQSSGFKPQRSSSGGQEARVRRAVKSALSQTEKAVRNVAALKSIIAKTGAGTTSSLMFEDSLDIVLELADKTDISEIARILERVEVSRLPSSRTVASPRGWITGIELGGDLERIHPSRLALPEELFLAELANARLLLYRKEMDSEMGPVYVLLDKSGSMSGHKINWARAVALALLIKSRGMGRSYFVRFFDSIVYDLRHVSVGSRSREVMELVRYLATVRASGGTNITAAVAKAVEDIQSRRARGVSDIVLITDGEDKLSTHIMSGIIEGTGINLHSVMIGGHNPTLEKVSKTYLTVRRLDEGEALQVVKLVIS